MSMGCDRAVGLKSQTREHAHACEARCRSTYLVLRKHLKATDQTIANCGAVKRPNQNMTQHHDVTMYVTYSNSLTAIMLTLDPTTLFFWTISDPPPKKMKYSVESWAKYIPSNAKPASCAPSQALTTASSRSATSSVLTSAITISAHVPLKIKQEPDSVYTYDGGISDREETSGVERDAAHASPIKGKKRLTSEVSTFTARC